MLKEFYYFMNYLGAIKNFFSEGHNDCNVKYNVNVETFGMPLFQPHSCPLKINAF